MAYNKQARFPDGQQLVVYSDGNSKAGMIRMDGDSLTLNGSGSNVAISNGANLVFLGSNATIGGTSSILSLGNSGDAINLNVSGVTYNVGTLTGNPTITGNTSVGGNLSVGGTLTPSTMSGTIDMTGATLSWAKNTDTAKIHYVDYNTTDDSQLTIDVGDRNTDYLRIRGANTSGVLENVMDVANSSVKVYGTLNATTLQENGTSLSSKYLGISSKATDSDKLDSLDSSQFVRSDEDDTMTGVLTISKNTQFPLKLNSAGINQGPIGIQFDGVGNASQLGHFYADHLDGNAPNAFYSFHVGSDQTDTSFVLDNPGTGNFYVGSNQVWHAGNDGHNSGLDADTLDGKHASDLLDVSHSQSSVDVNSLSLGTKLYAGSSGSWTNKGPSGHNGSGLLSINTHAGSYYSQLWFDTNGNNFYHRSIDAGSIRSWQKVWTDANDGSGSGLNADKLDDLDSADFLRSNTNGTLTGSLTVTGNTTVDSNLNVKGLIGLTDIAGAYREGGKINLLSRMSGRLLNKNSDFILTNVGGSATAENIPTGYDKYDNNNSGRTRIYIVQDDTTPNANGKIMRIDYDPARNATTGTSPGWGGFKTVHSRDTGTLSTWGYRAGNRYLYRIVAKIPVGRNIQWASNSFGVGGATEWLTPRAGTGLWEEYILVQTIGELADTSSTFSATGYFYVESGAEAAFIWDVAIHQIIGLDEVPDVDRAPTLNVGYKSGVDLGWGDIYATGKITTDSSMEVKGDLFLAGNDKDWAIRATGENFSIVEADDTNKEHFTIIDGGNIELKPNGTLALALTSAGDAAVSNSLAVTNELTVNGNKSYFKGSHIMMGGSSTEWFRIEAPNKLYLQYGYPTKPVDIGKTGNSLELNVYGNITGTGTASFGGTTATSLTVNGNASITGKTTIGSNNVALQIGDVTIGNIGNKLIVTNLDELRFGSTTSATWSYNSWGGIKYISGSNTMVIGGPASASFSENASPSRISLNFEGIETANLDGALTINRNGSPTIGGATFTNGWLQIGPSTNGLAIDPNELYFTGDTGIIGTIGAHNLSLRYNASEKLAINSTGASVTGSLGVSGDLSVSGKSSLGKTIITSGADGLQLKSGSTEDHVFIRFFADSQAQTTSSGWIGYGSGGSSVLTIANGMGGGINLNTNTTVSGSLESTGITSSSNVTINGANNGLILPSGGKIYENGTDLWIRFSGPIYAFTNTIRTDGSFQIGDAGATLNINSNAFQYRSSLWADGTKVGIGKQSAGYKLDVYDDLGDQGINLQVSDNNLRSGLTFQNTGGAYTWYMSRVNDTSLANSADLVFYSTPNTGYEYDIASLVPHTRMKRSGDFLVERGNLYANGRLKIHSNSGRTDAPAITLAIGDSDTGLNWVSDGNLDIYANSQVVAGISSSSLNMNKKINMSSNNIDAAGTITAKAIGNTDSGLYLPFVGGGSYTTATSSITGAIKITLPQSWTSTMMRFTIEVYEYTTNESFSVHVGGYNYNHSTNPNWVNTTAQVIGSKTDRDYSIRFGHDGTKCCIYIGELNSVWSYPQINIKDFFAGYGRYDIVDWDDGWSVGFEATAFGTISSTQTNNFPYASWSRDSDKLDNLDSSQFLRSDVSDTMDGTLSFSASRFASQGGAIDLNNSDILGANSIFFNDTSESGEGLHFAKSGTAVDDTATANYYTLRIDGAGSLYSDVHQILDGDGNLYFNNKMLISNNGGSTNIDHIWHDDSTNTWHFVSDGAAKSTGNSKLQTGGLISNGNINLSNNAVIFANMADGTATGLFQLSTTNTMFLSSDSVSTILRGNALTIRPHTIFEGNILLDGNNQIQMDRDRAVTSKIYWNASSTAQYGMTFQVDGTTRMILGHESIANTITGDTHVENGHLKVTGTWPKLEIIASNVGADPEVHLGAPGGSWSIRNDDSDGNDFEWRWNNAFKMNLSTTGELTVGSHINLTGASEFKVDGVLRMGRSNSKSDVFVWNNTGGSGFRALDNGGTEVIGSTNFSSSITTSAMSILKSTNSYIQMVLQRDGTNPGSVFLGNLSNEFKVGKYDPTNGHQEYMKATETGVVVHGDMTLGNDKAIKSFGRNQIEFYGTESYGNGISIGAGGTTIVGGGESNIATKDAVLAAIGNAGHENLYLTSDNNIYFYTQMQNGYNTRKEAIFGGSSLSINGSTIYHGSNNDSYTDITSNGWYTIATNPGDRAFAKFTVMDAAASMHHLIQFTAGTAYNRAEGVNINLISNVKFNSTDEVFGGIRVLTKTTYDTQYLQVYIMAGARVKFIMEDNYWTSGWTPVDFKAESPTGYTPNKLEMQGGFQNRPQNIFSGTAAPPSQGSSIGDIYVQY